MLPLIGAFALVPGAVVAVAAVVSTRAKPAYATTREEATVLAEMLRQRRLVQQGVDHG